MKILKFLLLIIPGSLIILSLYLKVAGTKLYCGGMAGIQCPFPLMCQMPDNLPDSMGNCTFLGLPIPSAPDKIPTDPVIIYPTQTANNPEIKPTVPAPTFILPPPRNLEYTKVAADLTKPFFLDIKYPEELALLNSRDILNLKCSENYFSDDGKIFSRNNGTNAPVTYLTDEKVLALVKQISDGSGEKFVSSVRMCLADEKPDFLIYGISPCGGGCSGIPHLSTVSGNKVNDLGVLPQKYAYGSCFPLVLTRAGQFYFDCSGSDGGGSGALINRFDIRTKSVSTLIECIGYPDDNGIITPSCK